MFTKPRRFSACSAPAFVQRAVRPGRLGFFVESSGSVNLLRMERTSLRASSSTCVLRSTRFEIRTGPALSNHECFPCASARSQSNKIPVNNNYNKNPFAWRAAPLSPTLAFDIRSMCRLGLLPAFNLHSFSTQRHVPCCSCRARHQPLQLSGGTLAQRPALVQV